MKRQIVYFDKSGYNKAANELKEIISIINSFSSELKESDYLFTIEDLQLIASRDKQFTTKAFLKYLAEICDTFGLDIEEVKTFEYTIKTNGLFSNMARNKARYLFELKDNLLTCFCCGMDFLADTKYIELNNNVASPTINAFELLEEHYTTYTSSDKENKILELTNELIQLYDKYSKLGIPRYVINNLVSNNNTDINIDTFRLIV